MRRMPQGSPVGTGAIAPVCAHVIDIELSHPVAELERTTHRMVDALTELGRW